MPHLADKLSELSPGTNCVIYGVTVECISSDGYRIRGRDCDLSQALTALDDASAQRGIPYADTAFHLAPPYAGVPYAAAGCRPNIRRIRNRSEHRALLDEARRKRQYIYYTSVVALAEAATHTKYYTDHRWLVDWESVPDTSTDVNVDSNETGAVSGGLRCVHCGKVCTSTSGLTNHLKAKHHVG